MTLNMIFIGTRFGSNLGLRKEWIPLHNDNNATFICRSIEEKMSALKMYRNIKEDSIVVMV